LWQLAPEAPVPADLPPLRRQTIHWQLLTSEGERSCTTQLDMPIETVTEWLAPEFPGAFIAVPPGSGRPPVVIVLGGSEGGDAMAREYAPRLLRLGLAVVGFPYYNPLGTSRPDLAGLPTAFAEISVDRLDTLAARLRASGRVDMDRVAVLGGSKGAEFALLAASRMPWIRATAAIVPSDVVWEGWGRAGPPAASFAWQGAGFDYMPYEGMAAEIGGYVTGAEVRLLRPHVRGRARHPDRAQAAAIPVESITGALLVAGGMDDQLWPSGAMALSIAERRARFGLPTQVLVFPSAGHGLFGDGSELTAAMDRGPSKVGGTPAANAAAKLATWRALRQFLLDSIGHQPGSAGAANAGSP
jgi:dienelactone hydrolase